eukprot:3323694-Amphidinium_carterae.2
MSTKYAPCRNKCAAQGCEQSKYSRGKEKPDNLEHRRDMQDVHGLVGRCDKGENTSHGASADRAAGHKLCV